MLDFDAMVYRLPDGRIWDVQESRFVQEVPAGKWENYLNPMQLTISIEDYLYNTLVEHNWDAGELKSSTTPGASVP